MSLENRILSALVCDRNAFDSVRHLVEADDFIDLHKQLLKEVIHYYDNDEQATRVELEWLLNRLRKTIKNHDHFVQVEVILDRLQDVSVPNIVEEYVELRTEAKGKDLAAALEAGEPYAELLDEFNELVTTGVRKAEDNTITNPDLGTLLDTVRPDNLITAIGSGNAGLMERLDGGFVPGTQVAVYAPTEVGKSLFTINLACGFLANGYKVLYCGNEDPASQMLLRFYSRMSRMTKKEMLEDQEKARQEAYRVGMANLVFKPMSPGSVNEIRQLVKRYEPKILIVDQMANLTADKNLSKVEKNEYLATKLRALTQQEGLVTVIVHQASDDAYGKKFLDKNHLYYSNVGVQGAQDVMIGIGMDRDMEQLNQRMICITKNKLSSNHDCYPVRVDPHLSRVVDL